MTSLECIDMIDNINPNQQPELSEQDAELLSAYIDDMLPIDDRHVLEARLNNEPFLQRELSALRQTVTWVNALPTLKAPHDFTISAEDVTPAPQKIIPIPQRNNWFMASVAAIIITIIGIVAILPNLTSSSPTGDVAQEQVAFANTAPADFESADEADGVNTANDFSVDSAEEIAPAPEVARDADPETQAQQASAGIDNRSQSAQPTIVMAGQGNAPENASSSETMGIVQAESEATTNYDADDTAPNSNIAASSAMMDNSIDDELLEEAETEDMQDNVSDMPEADIIMMDTIDISPVQRAINLINNWLEIIRQIFTLIQS